MARVPPKAVLLAVIVAAMTSVLLFQGAVAARNLAASGSAVLPLNGTQYRTSALACSKSSLAGGYVKKVMLKSKLFFHWKVVGTTLFGAIEAQPGAGKNGWISVAWTKRPGKMDPADAVVGNLQGPTTVKGYAMTGSKQSQVKPSTALRLSATSVATTASATVIKFKRSGKTGLSPINYAGNNNMIWAYSSSGSSKTFAYHGSNWGSMVINLACK